MKRVLPITVIWLATALASAAGTPASRELLDNSRVWVEEVTFAPGDEEPEHTHKVDVLLIAISGSAIESTTPDGEVTRLGEKPGDVLFLPKGSTHRARNNSGEPAVLRVIVLK